MGMVGSMFVTEGECVMFLLTIGHSARITDNFNIVIVEIGVLLHREDA